MSSSPSRKSNNWTGAYSYDYNKWTVCDAVEKTNVFVAALKHFKKTKNGQPYSSLETEYSYKYIFPIFITKVEADFAYVSNPYPPRKENYGFFKLSIQSPSSESSKTRRVRADNYVNEFRKANASNVLSRPLRRRGMT